MKFNFSKYKIYFAVAFFFAQLFYFENIFSEDKINSAKATITISFSEKDSVRQVKAQVTKSDSAGKENPVKGIEVHFYVKKSFGLLPIEGDNSTTDENGNASVDFLKNLPGDSLGNVTVIAKVEDNDILGNLETIKVVKWGVPSSNTTKFYRRALWASGKNAPVPLVIIVSGMVAGAWAVIIYIIYQLIQIKKSANYEIKNQT